MKVEWNNCFLCLNDLTGRQVGDSRDGVGIRDLGKFTTKIELLFNYLLTDKTGDYSGVIDDIKQLLEGKEGGGSGVKFCEKCEGQLNRVSELHRELEVVQMKLVSVLKAVKKTVVQNSKKGGLDGNVGLEIFEQWMREQESNYAGEEGKEEEKTRLKEQRKILDTLVTFQEAVIEKEKNSVDIPLVFLERCNFLTSRPSEEALIIPEVTVKTEVPDLVDYLDTPIPDCDQLFDNLPPETVPPKPKRGRKRKTITAGVEIKREVLRPPRASTSTARLKMIEMSNRYKHKKKEPPSETDMSRPPPRKYHSIPPSFQKKPHSKLRTLKKGTSSSKQHLLYCCALCPFTIQYLYSMEEHLQVHETDAASQENPPPPQFQCDQCPSKFRVEQAFQFHMFGHTGHYQILCEPCNTWQAPGTFKDHLKSHLEKTFPCPNCSFCGTTRQKYIYHLYQYHLNSSRLECDICGERSSGKQKLFEHYYEVHQAIEKLVCGVEGCSKEFLNPAKFTAHKNTHTDKFRCSHCDTSFPNGSFLKDHLAVIAGENRWLCKLCQESFPSKYALQMHKVKEHGVAKYKCDICEKEFLDKSRLNGHRRLHTGEGFTCEHPGCGKVYESGTRLRRHMILHSTERNFVCDLCGVALKSAVQLKKHKRTHAGEDAKKFECSQCGKRFLFEKYLRHHLDVHKGNRPHICEACGKGFNQASTLYRHKQKCFLGPAPPVIKKRDERAKPIKFKVS